MDSGIYVIENKRNGKCYIGSSSNLKNRFYNHKILLKNNKHYNNFLQNAWNKYGDKNFNFQILIDNVPINELIQLEQKFLDIFKPEYNLAPVAGSKLGVKDTYETKIKKSKAKSGINNPNYGKTTSIETKSKISNSLLNNNVLKQPRSEEFKNKIRASSYKNNTSGFKGVSYDKSRNKYRAYVYLNNKIKTIGRFETALEAKNFRQEFLNHV